MSILSHSKQLERIIKVDFFDLKKSFCNKSRSVITIRLDVEYPATLNYFLSLKKVHNFIDISVFKWF